MRFKLPPVKADDEIEVEIIGKGKKGDGVAKLEDYIIFVPGTDVGDKLKVKITKVWPNCAFGEPVGKITKGAPKEEPPAEEEPKPEEATETPEAPAEEPPPEEEAKPEEEAPKEE